MDGKITDRNTGKELVWGHEEKALRDTIELALEVYLSRTKHTSAVYTQNIEVSADDKEFNFTLKAMKKDAR